MQATPEVADGKVRRGKDGPAYCGRVIIEWPAPGRSPVLPAWGCAIFDAETGKPVATAEKITIPAVTASAAEVITCELTMFADEDGNPVRDGKPHIRDGEVITGTFPFLVAEMRVGQ